MVVTELIEYGKRKKKIYIDGEYVFWLYKNELHVYDIFEGSELNTEKLSVIYKETILIRAKKHALTILEHMDRTEHELRLKLKQSGYTDLVIEEAVLYIRKYSYIDDLRYALNYIKNHMSSKSKNFMYNKLMQKGISKDQIEKAFVDVEDEVLEIGSLTPEVTALKKEILKKSRGISEFTLKDKQKLFASLCRKGYNYDMIYNELSLLGISGDIEYEQSL